MSTAKSEITPESVFEAAAEECERHGLTESRFSRTSIECVDRHYLEPGQFSTAVSADSVCVSVHTRSGRIAGINSGRKSIMARTSLRRWLENELKLEAVT